MPELDSVPDDLLREFLANLATATTTFADLPVSVLRSIVSELLGARARIAELEAAAKTLGSTVDRQCLDALGAIGEKLGGDLIDADGDGDWGLVWERVAEMAHPRLIGWAVLDPRGVNPRVFGPYESLDEANAAWSDIPGVTMVEMRKALDA